MGSPAAEDGFKVITRFICLDLLSSLKLVERFHMKTLHGGVLMTMTAVREEFWIPRLRRLTKKVIFVCFLCICFRANHFPAPAPGLLPHDRTDGVRPFQVLGLD